MDFEILRMMQGSIFSILIGVVLFYASYEDLKNRTIRGVWVICLFILVCIHTILAGNMNLQATYVFIFCLILFMLLAILSKGRFGIGDAMVLGALGWYYNTFIAFQHFLFAMAGVCIPWAVFCVLYYGRSQGFVNAIRGFKSHININEARPGMVLANDNFMHGLTQDDIDRMRHAGQVTIDVKQPFPFIPVIFIAYVITLFI